MAVDTIKPSAVIDYGFVRETFEDLYSLLNELKKTQPNANIEKFIDKIIPPKTTTNDVHEMSVYLYDFIPEKKSYSNNFYLYCKKLYQKEVEFRGEEFLLSYEHVPVQGNPYHFQLFTKDSKGNRIPRDTKVPSEKKFNKALALIILKNWIAKAVCYDKNDLPKWGLNT